MKEEEKEELERFMSLTPEQRREHWRNEFRYLPSDQLMAAAGYHHEYLGLYGQRKPDGALYEISFFARSGTIVLSRNREGVSAKVVSSDVELAQLLAEYHFPLLNKFS